MAKEKQVETKLSVIDEIQKKLGAGSIFKLSDKEVVDVPILSTGSIGLDAALGIGGVPRGRISEIYGQSGTGKSFLCLNLVKSAQQKNLRCAIIDTEYALDSASAELLGINLGDLFVSQPTTGNESFEIAEMLLKSKEFGLIIVDSAASLTPQEEVNADFGDSVVGRRAKLIAQGCRKLNPLVGDSDTALVFTNQLIDNIGAMGYGPTTITPGGKSLGFFSSVRIELSKVQQVKSGEDVSGHIIKAKVVKNRLAPPYKEARYEITYGMNAVKVNELLNIGAELGIVEKSGAWYSYNGSKLGQGKEKSRDFLLENPTLMEEIEQKIRMGLGLGVE